MIELQYDWVGLATVNAGVRSQKFKNAYLVALSLGGVLVLTPQYILRAVLCVVGAKVRSTATTTKRM